MVDLFIIIIHSVVVSPVQALFTLCAALSLPVDAGVGEEAGADPGAHGGRGHREDAGAQEDLVQDQLRRPEGPQRPAARQPRPLGHAAPQRHAHQGVRRAQRRPQPRPRPAEPGHAAELPGKKVGGPSAAS